METISIHGKEYVTVNERLKEFRTKGIYKGYSLVSEIIKCDEEQVIIKALVLDETGKIIATGLAQEFRTSSLINKTSYVENCETSAWGRALGNLGIGIDVSVCTADEVIQAIDTQAKLKDLEKNLDKELLKRANELGMDLLKVCNYFRTNDLTNEQLKEAIEIKEKTQVAENVKVKTHSFKEGE